MERDVILSGENISKNFGITKALQNVDFQLYRGEVLGLIGENGSGKSTLSSIISASQHADSGSMMFKGQLYHPATVVEATQLGVNMIVQEKGTFSQLTTYQNIFAGKEDLFRKNKVINTTQMISEAQKILNELGIDFIDVKLPFSQLSFEDMKLVELGRAMYCKPEILIVDETTTALSRKGRDIIYDIISKMKQEMKSVVFISHDIDEVMNICDRLIVLRDGKYVKDLKKNEFNDSTIRYLMVGREIAGNFYRTDNDSTSSEEKILELKDIYSKSLHDINIALHKGEIIGVGGLTECGMHEIGEIAFGIKKPDYGNVVVHNKDIVKDSCKAVKHGIAYISKNRDQEALQINCSIQDNINILAYKGLETLGFISNKKEQKYAREQAKNLEVKMRDITQLVSELSGGNKQKVALAKWIGFEAEIFIMDCPTRGIDVGVKSAIYSLMVKLKQMGKGIILISEEFPELIGMCDRTYFIKNGSVSGTVTREEQKTERDLIEYII